MKFYLKILSTSVLFLIYSNNVFANEIPQLKPIQNQTTNSPKIKFKIKFKKSRKSKKS